MIVRAQSILPGPLMVVAYNHRHYAGNVVLLGVVMLSGCGSNATTSLDPDNSPTKSEAIANKVDHPDPLKEKEIASLFEVSDSAKTAGHGNLLSFHNVANSSGAQFQRFNDAVPDRYFLPEVMGGGVAWFDFDGDGLMDLYATNGCRLWDREPHQSPHSNRLFRNRRGVQFSPVEGNSGTGDTRYGQGCAAEDFNADGFPDLFVTNYGRNTLLVSNGDGTFDDNTVTAGVDDESWGTSAVWLDANRDGLADLFVVNYVDIQQSNHDVCTYGGVTGYCGPGRWDGVADNLYLNNGDGQFRLSTTDGVVDSKMAKGLAVAVCDFDSDSLPEIYVANDMAPNYLLTQNDKLASDDALGLYHDAAPGAGCAVSGDGRNEASMGVACSDLDNDGKVDIFLTHYFNHKNTLYRNLDGLLFEDNSRRSRAAATSYQTLGFGTVAADFDLDGDNDLFIANGHVLGEKHTPNGMKPQLLENDGRGLFDDASVRCGDYFLQQVIGRGVARGDYDNDGRADLAVSHVDQPMAVLHNETQVRRHFIGFQLMPIDRVYPVGGRVVVTEADVQHVVPIVGGGSYLSSSDPRIIVGLDENSGPVDVEVHWPGRASETFKNLSPSEYWQLQEGKKGTVFIR